MGDNVQMQDLSGAALPALYPEHHHIRRSDEFPQGQTVIFSDKPDDQGKRFLFFVTRRPESGRSIPGRRVIFNLSDSRGRCRVRLKKILKNSLDNAFII